MTDITTLSFEDALAELERIVRGLEGGQQKLEEAITSYERGALLRRHCETKLAEAEARVQAIVERADGTLTTSPVDAITTRAAGATATRAVGATTTKNL